MFCYTLLEVKSHAVRIFQVLTRPKEVLARPSQMTLLACSSDLEVVESLEKRVKSRMGHLQIWVGYVTKVWREFCCRKFLIRTCKLSEVIDIIHQWLNISAGNYTTAWQTRVNVLMNDKVFREVIKHLFSFTGVSSHPPEMMPCLPNLESFQICRVSGNGNGTIRAISPIFGSN